MEEESTRSGVHGVMFCEFDADANSVQSNHEVGVTPSWVRFKAKDRVPVYRSQSASIRHGVGRILSGIDRSCSFV